MNCSHLSDSTCLFNPISVSGSCRRSLRSWAFAIIAGLAITNASAAEVDKANNTDNLNLTTSWVLGVLPGTNDTATWNGTITGPNTTVLGASTQWQGIAVSTPAGPVLINADGNTLTNGNVTTVGNVGIDMSAATQSLTLSNNVVVNGVQSWNIASGQTLTLGGGFTRNEGGVILFEFADSTSTVIITNGTSVLPSPLPSTNSVPNPMLGGTSGFGNNFFGTVNDTDFAALVPAAGGGLQVVGGSTIPLLYQTNGSANLDPNNANVINVVTDDAAAFGQRASNGRTWSGFRFNIPQLNSLVVYKGLDAWEINIPSGRTVTCNAILITTNVGNSPVLINNGGQSGGTTGFFRIGSGGAQDLLIYQNNPAAPLVVQPNIDINQQGAGTLVKMGVGTMIIQSPADTYTNGTKIYGGTLEIDGTANVGVGPLNVFGGNFAQSSGGTNNAALTTVFGIATNSILVNAANSSALDNSNLTYSAGAHLELVYSNTVSPSATAPALLVTNVSSGLTVSNTITVDIVCGSLSTGQYPLIKYAGTIGGDGGNAFALGLLEPHAQGYISNNVANNSIDLVVTNITQPITWSAGTGVWDIATTANWLDTALNSTTYQQNAAGGDNVVFNDSPTGASFTVTLDETPTPASVTFGNNTKNYTLSGSGSIDGIGSVTMSGSGTLFLQTTNFFTGGINMNAGIVNFTTISNLGAAGISFNGGTLQYASNTLDDISVRAVTFNAGSGTIDVNSNAVAFSHPIGNSGAGGFTLTGGTLQINGTNKYSGNTVVNPASTLTMASPNTYISNSAALVANGILDSSSAVDANGFSLVLNGSANQQIDGTGTVKGEISTSIGTTISPATNGVVGTLTLAGDLTVNGGTIAMDIVGPTGASRDALAITAGGGSGNLTLNGGLNAGTVALNVTGTLNNGVYPLITYPGTLLGSVGNLVLAGFNQPGSLAYLTASGGAINLNVIPGATNSLVWNGLVNNIWDGTTPNWTSNGVTGQVFQNGDKATLDDTGINPGILLGDAGVSGSGTLLPGMVTINATNNNYSFADGVGDGSGQWLGNMVLIINSGAANVTTILTPNGNNGGTAINGGTLQVGNGTVTGDLGAGNITNKGTLVFDQTDSRSVPGVVSGSGNLIQEGSADLILLANNSYTGATIISNGNSTLQVGAGGAVGTLGTGPVTNNGTLFVDRSGAFALNNITGSGSVVLAGGAAFSLTGTNTWLGNTYLTNGSIKLAATNQIPNTNTVPGSTGNLGLAGILDLNGFNQDVNGLTDLGLNTGRITNSAASGTNILTIGLNAASNSLVYTGTIVDVTNRSGIRVVIDNPGTVALAAANTYRGGTFVGGGATLSLGTAGSGGIPGSTAAGTGGIIMSNGTSLFMNGNTITFVANPVTIAPASTVSFNSQALGDQYSGQISGPAGSTNIIAGPWTSSGVGGYNGFLGTVVVPTGGDIRFFGTPAGGTNTTFDLTGTGVLQTRTTEMVFIGTLIGDAAGGSDDVGNPIGGGITAPNAGGTGNIVIGSANTSSTYYGAISGANNIYKTGTGTLVLVSTTNAFSEVLNSSNSTISTNYFMTNGLTYTGATTVSNGVLSIVAPANLNGTNFTSFTLASNTAVLDLSSAGSTPDGVTLVTNSTLALGSGQTLTGLGTIMGSLVASNGSTVSVALPSNTNGLQSTGALNITNSVELGGLINININASNAVNSGEIVSPTITIDPTAALVVTNLGPQAGATFQLFSQAVSGFASVTLPPLTGTNAWVNNLSVNGSITLEAPPLVTGPTNNAEITGFLLSGTNLVVVGTNNNVPNTSFHYVVLSATNITTPLSNWIPVVTNGFNTNGTFDYTNPIIPGTPRQFLDTKAVP